jgi:predicted DsbA family dithiol-disulfide isomerase
MASLNIELFTDICCPWCFVGTRRLEQALAEIGTSADVTIVHRPFLLFPATPPEGIDVAAMLRERYGAADARQVFAPAEAAARETGFALDLTKQPRACSTVAAHTLLRHADARGTGRAVADALYVAHFIDAKNVSQPDVLADVAQAHGFTPDEARRLVQDEGELNITRQDAQSAGVLGVRGVPHAVFNGRVALPGAQPLAVFRQAVASALV